ncbi:MAG: hypothetical protein ACLFPL_03505 [Candidatus Nanoarchaeia archaeon]
MSKSFDKYNSSKKGVEDLPISFLIELTIGLFAIVAIAIPIYQMFIYEDYNRAVALDASYSIKNYIDYTYDNYANLDSQCLEPFKLQYLSTPQVLIEDKNNYVITIETDKISLITYDDFLTLLDENKRIDSDFRFNTITLEEKLPDFSLIEMGVNTARTDNSNSIEMIFLVPNIAAENSLTTGSTGSFLSGYYVFYGINEGSALKIEPDAGWINEIFNEDLASDADLYDIGFYRENGNRFGVLKNNNARLNVMGTCDKPQENTDEDNSFNSKGFSCSASYTQELKNGESEKKTVRNNIYWSGSKSSYQCGSEFDGGRNFCSELEQNPPLDTIFNDNIHKLNGDSLASMKTNFKNFCKNFYESIDSISVLKIEHGEITQEQDPIVYSTEFEFFDFFEKVEVEDIVQNIESRENDETKPKIFKRNYISSQDCKTSEVEKEQFEEVGVDEEDVCSRVYEYKTQENGKQRIEYIFYVPLQREENKGFYKVKDNSQFNVIRNQRGEITLSIGNRQLEDSRTSLQDVDCSFLSRVGGTITFGLLGGCENLEVYQTQINENFFTDVINPTFNIFLPSTIKDSSRRDTTDVVYSFEDLFTKVSENNQAGENNEPVEINGEEYILNTQYLDTNINEIIFNMGVRRTTDEYDVINRLTTLQFKTSTTQGIENNLHFNPFKEYQEDSRALNNFEERESINTLQFEFESGSTIESLEYTPSFEQVMLSIYDSQSLSINDIKKQIENREIQLTVRDNVVGNEQTLYFTTKNPKKPIFQTLQNHNDEQVYVLSPFSTSYQFQELYKNENDESIYIDETFIFPNKNSNGDIVLEEIPFTFTREEFFEIVESSGFRLETISSIDNEEVFLIRK